MHDDHYQDLPGLQRDQEDRLRILRQSADTSHLVLRLPWEGQNVLPDLQWKRLGYPARQQTMNPLDNVLIANDIASIERLLDADPGLINRADHRGRTPIDLAVSRSKVEVVELLLRRGAVINKREHVYGAFPLLQAVARKRKEIVELLLRHGADTTMADKEFGTAHDLAVAMDQADIAELLCRGTNQQQEG